MTDVTEPGLDPTLTRAVVLPPPLAPGWKTSELWLKLLALVLVSVLSSGLLTSNTAVQVVSICVTVLASLGYTAARTSLKKSQAGFVRLGLVAFVAITGGIALGCAWMKSESKVAAGDVVDCTGATAKAHIKEYGPLADAALVYMTGGDGHVDKAAVKSSAIGMLVETGGCVLADAVARALTPHADPNAPKSSPLEADRASLLAAFESVRSEQLAHKKFHTPHGDL